VGGCLKLSQGHFENGRALPGQGPGPQPAAVALVVDADHLIELPVMAVIGELDAVALMKIGTGAGHGGRLVRWR
jgi:hypothetical protein